VRWASGADSAEDLLGAGAAGLVAAAAGGLSGAVAIGFAGGGVQQPGDGGTVDFSEVADWSVPSEFSFGAAAD